MGKERLMQNAMFAYCGCFKHCNLGQPQVFRLTKTFFQFDYHEIFPVSFFCLHGHCFFVNSISVRTCLYRFVIAIYYYIFQPSSGISARLLTNSTLQFLAKNPAYKLQKQQHVESGGSCYNFFAKWRVLTLQKYGAARLEVKYTYLLGR